MGMKWSKAFSLGESKRKAGETTDAIRYFKKALAIAKTNGSTKEEAVTLERLGAVLNAVESYHEAVEYYEKGLEIVQETDDIKVEYEMCKGIGLAYRKLGHHEKSMNYAKRGYNAASKSKDSKLIASSYEGLGYAYHFMCDCQSSIKCYTQAIDLYKQLNDEEQIGVCYGNLSAVYTMQGKYHDAISFRERSLKVSVEMRNNEHEAGDLLELGAIYARLNDFDKAIELYQKSLTISKINNYKSLQAKCYCTLGNIMNTLELYQDAIRYYLECLVITVEINDKQTQAAATLNIGTCYKDLKCYEEADEHFAQSVIIAKEINDAGLEGLVLYNLGDLYAQMNDFQLAVTLLERSLDIAFTIENKELYGKSCSFLGEIYYLLHKESQDRRQGQEHHNSIANAEDYLRKALHCFDFLFQHLHQRDHLKVSIFDGFAKTYKLLTTVLIETERPQEALLLSDDGRARALGDILIIKYGMIENECSFSKPLSYPDVQVFVSDDCFSVLHFNLLKNSLAVWVLAKGSLVFKETEKKLLDLALEALTEQENSNHENTMNRVFTKTVARAYETMHIKESVICENRSLDDCVTSKYQASERCNESTSRDEGTSGANIDQASPPLEMLYNCLVAPVLTHLQHDEVVIVPDGPLYAVPFAALRDPNTGQYLSDTKRIRLAPSIAILKALKECPVDHHSQKGALIVGDPSVGEVMFRGKKRIFERLPSADREVSYISFKLGQRALTGEQATKDVVLERLRQGSAVIHIAAHGSSHNGEIMLAPNVSSERQGIPEEDDYLLTMKEVQEIGIKAQLVVLSCCYSGRGKIRAEGMVGLSRAFLAAGARAVVASLWAIDDIVTFSFMVSFYGYLTRGESASVSLHKAMNDIRKEGHREPKDWAPYFLIGDDVILGHHTLK